MTPEDPRAQSEEVPVGQAIALVGDPSEAALPRTAASPRTPKAPGDAEPAASAEPEPPAPAAEREEEARTEGETPAGAATPAEPSAAAAPAPSAGARVKASPPQRGGWHGNVGSSSRQSPGDGAGRKEVRGRGRRAHGGRAGRSRRARRYNGSRNTRRAAAEPPAEAGVERVGSAPRSATSGCGSPGA